MTTKVFKVGDRIALYNCGLRFVGTIKKFTDKGNIIVNGDGVGVSWHPKQCRRLKPKVKKEPRRVWIPEERIDNLLNQRAVTADISINKETYDDIEFIEVINAQKNKET